MFNQNRIKMEKISNQMEGCCDKMKEMISKKPEMKQMMQSCMEQFFKSEQKTEEKGKESSDQSEDSTKKACC